MRNMKPDSKKGKLTMKKCLSQDLGEYSSVYYLLCRTCLAKHTLYCLSNLRKKQSQTWRRVVCSTRKKHSTRSLGIEDMRIYWDWKTEFGRQVWKSLEKKEQKRMVKNENRTQEMV